MDKDKTPQMAPFGWVAYNGGPVAFCWAEHRDVLEHELTDSLRPATQAEKALFTRFCRQGGGGVRLMELGHEEDEEARVCPICDGGPGNSGSCSCPREMREAIARKELEEKLRDSETLVKLGVQAVEEQQKLQDKYDAAHRAQVKGLRKEIDDLNGRLNTAMELVDTRNGIIGEQKRKIVAQQDQIKELRGLLGASVDAAVEAAESRIWGEVETLRTEDPILLESQHGDMWVRPSDIVGLRVQHGPRPTIVMFLSRGSQHALFPVYARTVERLKNAGWRGLEKQFPEDGGEEFKATWSGATDPRHA